jgi:hypothetical protein
MKINLGCGFNHVEGFVNVDSDKRCKPDKVVDFSKGKLPFKDNEVDLVTAYNFFEKLEGNLFLKMMQELYRVCSNGAIIEVQFVHPRHDSFFSNPLNVRPLTTDTFRNFSKKFGKVQEKNNKTVSLAETLDVDFEIIDFRYGIDPAYQDTLKENNQGQIEELSKRFCNVYSQVGIKLAVMKDI